MANEPDREKRKRLEHARNALTEEHLQPLQLEAAQVRPRPFARSARPTTASCTSASASSSPRWASGAARFLDETERLWEDAGDKLFRARVGVRSPRRSATTSRASSARRSGTRAFPADKMMPALEATLADLGIDLTRRRTSSSTSSSARRRRRARSARRSRCPDRVVLVIQPIGGVDDWRALFHEAGHTEHFAHTRADLSVEERRLGDYAVTEGWAMLLEHLVQDAAWLNRRLDVPRPPEFVAESATGLLYLVRRYCAKVLYELELHVADDPRTMQPRYVELLADALKIEPSATDYLGDVDAGFYSPSTSAPGPSRRSSSTSSARSSARRGSRSGARGRCSTSSGGGPAPDRGRDAEGRDRRRDRARGRCGVRARRARRRVAAKSAPPAAGGADGSTTPWSPTGVRASESSASRMFDSSARSTSFSRSLIDETSSRCSFRNQCIASSPTKSPSSRASFSRLRDLLRHALLLRERDRAPARLRPRNRCAAPSTPGSSPAGRRRGGTGRASSRGSAPRPPGGRSARRGAAASRRRSRRRPRCTAARRRTRSRSAR